MPTAKGYRNILRSIRTPSCFFLTDLPNLLQSRMGRIHEASLQSGDLSVIPALTPQRWQWRENTAKTLHLRVNPVFLQEVAAENGYNNLTEIELLNNFQVRDPQIEYIARSLLSELTSGGICGRLYAELLANRLVMYLLHYYSNLGHQVHRLAGRLSKSRLNLVIEYINEHIEESISLADLASLVQVDTYWFAKMFKRTTGLAPHQYVIERRVEKAKILLLTTELSIAEIAHHVGFADQAHLTRHFKHLVGITPGVLVRNVKLR